MAIKVILKDGDELHFSSYAIENNNILHLHGTAESLQEHVENMSKLSGEQAKDLYIVSTDLKNWAQLTDCEYVSEQSVVVDKSEDEKVRFVDYYLSSLTPPNQSIEILNILEAGVADAELLAEIEQEKNNE